jgi:hypothetical protein
MNLDEDNLQHIPFDGVNDYIAALDEVCGLAQQTLYIFEKNFADIGFNAEARYDTLRRFLLANSTAELHLLTHDTQYLTRFCPRMMMLLQQFSNNMFIYRTPSYLQHVTGAFAVADNAHYVRRFHFDDTRGILAKHDAEGARELKSRFNEMWQASHSGVSATTLGL